MSDDSPAEVRASPPASEEAGRAPAEAQGKPHPTGRFKRILKDAADSEFVEWVVEKVLTGVFAVVGVAALALLASVVPDVADPVGNWIVNQDPELAVADFAAVGGVLLVAVFAILYHLLRAARWLAKKMISARRAARARRAADRHRADHRAGDDPGGAARVLRVQS